ncbi:MAG: hypothetical protein BWX88_02264 [Planctomycetes bacterium ADurb.Bin126]|nr:MAG: hypothetical protein BWX88_02264 [Planctomycetes bacterium ADurb.Bin126]
MPRVNLADSDGKGRISTIAVQFDPKIHTEQIPVFKNYIRRRDPVHQLLIDRGTNSARKRAASMRIWNSFKQGYRPGFLGHLSGNAIQKGRIDSRLGFSFQF